jgi:hypothetical protein
MNGRGTASRKVDSFDLTPSTVFILAAALLTVQQADSTRIREFTDVLRTNPIERVDSSGATTPVRGVVIADVDADGREEAVVWIAPRLRQTPTILLFASDTAGRWRRIAEGLAPGRLSRVSGQLRDPHSLGLAADLTAGDGSPEVAERFMAVGAASRMSFVAYQGFLHSDYRQDATFIIDLQKWQLPRGVDKTCESFEFAPVETVIVGTLAGSEKVPYVVALTGQDVTVYRISAIAPAGRLTATSAVRARDGAVRGLSRLPDGSIALATRSGTRPIAPP